MNTIYTVEPTIKQVEFIKQLITRTEDPDDVAEALLAFEDTLRSGLDRKGASEHIDTLLARQRNKNTTEDRKFDPTTVPAGRYALTEDGETAFYQVDRPTKGRWDGWTFVNLIHPGGDRIRQIKGGERGKALALLAINPTSYSAEYGKHTGTCGVCARLLSDPESVARGIGPVCASRLA